MDRADRQEPAPSGPYRPDALDRRLIALLRADGRAPVASLAAALGVARGTVQTRLARLLAEGVILGFTARLRAETDASSIRAVMMIEVAGKASAEVARRLRGRPEVVALHTTNGVWDLVAEIRAADLAEFDRLLRETRMIDGVLNSQTSLMLATI